MLMLFHLVKIKIGHFNGSAFITAEESILRLKRWLRGKAFQPD